MTYSQYYSVSHKKVRHNSDKHSCLKEYAYISITTQIVLMKISVNLMQFLRNIVRTFISVLIGRLHVKI